MSRATTSALPLEETTCTECGKFFASAAILYDHMDKEHPSKCPVCDKNAADNTIACDGCELWHHMSCVNIEPHAVPESDWFCSTCVKSRRKTVLTKQKSPPQPQAKGKPKTPDIRKNSTPRITTVRSMKEGKKSCLKALQTGSYTCTICPPEKCGTFSCMKDAEVHFENSHWQPRLEFLEPSCDVVIQMPCYLNCGPRTAGKPHYHCSNCDKFNSDTVAHVSHSTVMHEFSVVYAMDDTTALRAFTQATELGLRSEDSASPVDEPEDFTAEINAFLKGVHSATAAPLTDEQMQYLVDEQADKTYHCKLCPPSSVLRSADAAKHHLVNLHVSSQIYLAQRWVLLPCYQDCGPPNHFHCPLCSGTYANKDKLVSHAEAHDEFKELMEKLVAERKEELAALRAKDKAKGKKRKSEKTKPKLIETKATRSPAVAKAARMVPEPRATRSPMETKATRNLVETKAAKSPGLNKAAKSPGLTKAVKSPGLTKAAKSPGLTKAAKSPVETKAPKSPALKSVSHGGLAVRVDRKKLVLIVEKLEDDDSEMFANNSKALVYYDNGVWRCRLCPPADDPSAAALQPHATQEAGIDHFLKCHFRFRIVMENVGNCFRCLRHCSKDGGDVSGHYHCPFCQAQCSTQQMFVNHAAEHMRENLGGKPGQYTLKWTAPPMDSKQAGPTGSSQGSAAAPHPAPAVKAPHAAQALKAPHLAPAIKAPVVGLKVITLGVKGTAAGVKGTAAGVKGVSGVVKSPAGVGRGRALNKAVASPSGMGRGRPRKSPLPGTGFTAVAARRVTDFPKPGASVSVVGQRFSLRPAAIKRDELPVAEARKVAKPTAPVPEPVITKRGRVSKPKRMDDTIVTRPVKKIVGSPVPVQTAVAAPAPPPQPAQVPSPAAPVESKLKVLRTRKPKEEPQVASPLTSPEMPSGRRLRATRTSTSISEADSSSSPSVRPIPPPPQQPPPPKPSPKLKIVSVNAQVLERHINGKNVHPFFPKEKLSAADVSEVLWADGVQGVHGCGLCPNTCFFVQRGAAETHFKKVHADFQISLFGKWVCVPCGRQCIETAGTLRHYHCPYCPEIIVEKSPGTLAAHAEIHRDSVESLHPPLLPVKASPDLALEKFRHVLSILSHELNISDFLSIRDDEYDCRLCLSHTTSKEATLDHIGLTHIRHRVDVGDVACFPCMLPCHRNSSSPRTHYHCPLCSKLVMSANTSPPNVAVTMGCFMAHVDGHFKRVSKSCKVHLDSFHAKIANDLNLPSASANGFLEICVARNEEMRRKPPKLTKPPVPKPNEISYFCVDQSDSHTRLTLAHGSCNIKLDMVNHQNSRELDSYILGALSFLYDEYSSCRLCPIEKKFNSIIEHMMQSHLKPPDRIFFQEPKRLDLTLTNEAGKSESYGPKWLCMACCCGEAGFDYPHYVCPVCKEIVLDKIAFSNHVKSHAIVYISSDFKGSWAFSREATSEDRKTLLGNGFLAKSSGSTLVDGETDEEMAVLNVKNSHSDERPEFWNDVMDDMMTLKTSLGQAVGLCRNEACRAFGQDHFHCPLCASSDSFPSRTQLSGHTFSCGGISGDDRYESNAKKLLNKTGDTLTCRLCDPEDRMVWNVSAEATARVHASKNHLKNGLVHGEHVYPMCNLPCMPGKGIIGHFHCYRCFATFSSSMGLMAHLRRCKSPEAATNSNSVVAPIASATIHEGGKKRHMDLIREGSPSQSLVDDQGEGAQPPEKRRRIEDVENVAENGLEEIKPESPKVESAPSSDAPQEEETQIVNGELSSAEDSFESSGGEITREVVQDDVEPEIEPDHAVNGAVSCAAPETPATVEEPMDIDDASRFSEVLYIAEDKNPPVSEPMSVEMEGENMELSDKEDEGMETRDDKESDKVMESPETPDEELESVPEEPRKMDEEVPEPEEMQPKSPEVQVEPLEEDVGPGAEAAPEPVVVSPDEETEEPVASSEPNPAESTADAGEEESFEVHEESEPEEEGQEERSSESGEQEEGLRIEEVPVEEGEKLEEAEHVKTVSLVSYGGSDTGEENEESSAFEDETQEDEQHLETGPEETAPPIPEIEEPPQEEEEEHHEKTAIEVFDEPSQSEESSNHEVKEPEVVDLSDDSQTEPQKPGEAEARPRTFFVGSEEETSPGNVVPATTGSIFDVDDEDDDVVEEPGTAEEQFFTPARHIPPNEFTTARTDFSHEESEVSSSNVNPSKLSFDDDVENP